MIQASGVAARTQKLKVGDRIVSINGQPLDGLSHADVVNLLKNAYGRIILQGSQNSTHSSFPPSLAPVITSLQNLVSSKRPSDPSPKGSGTHPQRNHPVTQFLKILIVGEVPVMVQRK